jgi:hypothetical protein
LYSRTDVYNAAASDGKLLEYYTYDNGTEKKEALYNANHGVNIDDEKKSVPELHNKIYCMDG